MAGEMSRAIANRIFNTVCPPPPERVEKSPGRSRAQQPAAGVG